MPRIADSESFDPDLGCEHRNYGNRKHRKGNQLKLEEDNCFAGRLLLSYLATVLLCTAALAQMSEPTELFR